MTSVLQPVDAAVGLSFKCAFRRLLVAHIITDVEKRMKLYVENRSIFKLTGAVTIFDSFVVMKLAWDMVAMQVVLNSWLTTDILSPYHSL